MGITGVGAITVAAADDPRHAVGGLSAPPQSEGAALKSVTRCAGGWHPCGWCGVTIRDQFGCCCSRCELWLYRYTLRRGPTARYKDPPTPLHLHGREILVLA